MSEAALIDALDAYRALTDATARAIHSSDWSEAIRAAERVRDAEAALR